MFLEKMNHLWITAVISTITQILFLGKDTQLFCLGKIYIYKDKYEIVEAKSNTVVGKSTKWIKNQDLVTLDHLMFQWELLFITVPIGHL